MSNREKWRDSRETCEYIAAALRYDDDAWESGDDSAAVYAEAARLALADGAAPDTLLCWGATSKTIADARGGE